MANPDPESQSLEILPMAVLATIMTKLDVPSICSVASTCKTFKACASHILSFLPNFHLLVSLIIIHTYTYTFFAYIYCLWFGSDYLSLFSQDIAPSIDLLRPLLPRNPYLRTLKVDCKRLDDSAIDSLIRPSLRELCLHNCSDFSGRLLSEVGARCKGLRFLLPLSIHRFLCDLRDFPPFRIYGNYLML